MELSFAYTVRIIQTQARHGEKEMMFAISLPSLLIIALIALILGMMLGASMTRPR
ncbi:MAG: hypothetical protein Fur0021_16210 [Candidatus Promineifilaceae bacterium]